MSFKSWKMRYEKQDMSNVKKSRLSSPYQSMSYSIILSIDMREQETLTRIC